MNEDQKYRLGEMLMDLASDCGQSYEPDALKRAVRALSEEVGARLRTESDWACIEEACRALRRTIAERRARGEYVGRVGPFDLALAFKQAPRVYNDPPCPRGCSGGVLTATDPEGRTFAIACDCPRGMRIRESSSNPLRDSQTPADVEAAGWEVV